LSGSDPVAAFRIEAAELLDRIELDLLDLGQDLDNRALVDAVFRGLHTLKGSGSMFGFDALASFTHHCETAFDRVRKGQARATAELVGVILSARDHMRALLDETDADVGREAAILAALDAAVAQGTGAAGAAAASPTSEPGWDLRFWLVPLAARRTARIGRHLRGGRPLASAAARPVEPGRMPRRLAYAAAGLGHA